MFVPSLSAAKKVFDAHLPGFLCGVFFGVAGMFLFLISLPKGDPYGGPTDDPPVWQEVFVPETLPTPLSTLVRPIAGPITRRNYRPTKELPKFGSAQAAKSSRMQPDNPPPPANTPVASANNPAPPADYPVQLPTNPNPPADR